MKLSRNTTALCVVPALLLVLSLAIPAVRGPFHLGYNSDPAYIYLFNSLSIARLLLPDYNHHPGTTLQVLGAGVLRARWAATCVTGDCPPLDASVLGDPERYQRAISLVLGLLVAGAALWAGWRIYRASGRLLPALVFQGGILLCVQILTVLGEVSPEPLLVFTVLVLAGVVAPLVFRNDEAPAPGTGTAVLAGVVLAFGLVTKVTFAPLLGIVLLFRGIRAKVAALLGCVVASAIFLVPILRDTSEMYEWFLRLVTREGKYGGGDVQLMPEAGIVAGNAWTLILDEPLLAISLACALTAALLLPRFEAARQLPDWRDFRRFLFVTSLILAVQLLITVKRPVPRYMVPAIVLVPLIFAATAHFLGRLDRCRPGVRLAALGGVALLALGAVIVTASMFSVQQGWREYRVDAEQLESRILSMAGCTPIGYYRASGLGPALYLGDGYANRRNAERLGSMYPDVIQYDPWKGSFRTLGRKLERGDIEALLEGSGCVLLHGVPLEGPETPRNDMVLERILVTPDQALYRLRGFDG